MIWRADYRELKTLRHSLRRVAEAAEARGAPLIIPPYGAERGWNTLCLNLIEWMGDRRVNLDGDRTPDPLLTGDSAAAAPYAAHGAPPAA